MAFDRLSEQLAVVATIDPDAYASTTLTTDVFDMSTHHEAMFVIQVGENAGTVDFEVQESTATGAGTNTTTAVASITQLTAGDDDVQVILVLARGGQFENAPVQIKRGPGPQPAQDAHDDGRSRLHRWAAPLTLTPSRLLRACTRSPVSCERDRV